MVKEGYFKSRFKLNVKRKKAWIVISKYFQKFIRRDSVILDLGSGYCDFINNIDAKEKHVLDIYKGIKKYAKDDIKVHIGDLTKMKKMKGNYFDIIFASNFFEHLTKKNLDNTFNELKRIIKKDGLLIVLQPNFKYTYKNYFDDYTHELAFTHISMSDYLTANGFKIIKIIPKFLPFSLNSKFPVMPFLIKLYLYSPIKPFGGQFLIIAEK